jgi:hypothetical protein
MSLLTTFLFIQKCYKEIKIVARFGLQMLLYAPPYIVSHIVSESWIFVEGRIIVVLVFTLSARVIIVPLGMSYHGKSPWPQSDLSQGPDLESLHQHKTGTHYVG